MGYGELDCRNNGLAPIAVTTLIPRIMGSPNGIRILSRSAPSTPTHSALIVNSRIPVKTVAEFVDHVRAQPNRLVYAEGGVGSISHLSMVLFLKRAGIEMTNVSYKGNAPALTDVIAGHVPTMFSVL